MKLNQKISREEEKDVILPVGFETFGNYGFALEYSEKEFVKAYPDVIVDFSVEIYDSGIREGIFYNGGKVHVTYESIEELESKIDYSTELYDESDYEYEYCFIK